MISPVATASVKSTRIGAPDRTTVTDWKSTAATVVKRVITVPLSSRIAHIML
jgi:hypothetical protein